MPIIAKHNQTYRSEGHTPSPDWPDDCRVQWGGSGLVIRREGGAYGTAFFEAFPREGGFFRGEGADIAAAEADCLARYQRFTICDHLWGRGTYTNGGAICRRCRAFMTRFHAIPRLGKHLDPISVMELDVAMCGGCHPGPIPDKRSVRYARRLWLRLARAGIRLPDPALPDYENACREAVLTWYRGNRSRTDMGETEGMAGLFDRMALRRLETEAA
jgi:hypothetical protein